MPDILIRGMEMPKSGGILCINIFPDGKVTRQLDLSCEQIATAVPLSDGHGRLVDADVLLEQIRDGFEEAEKWRDAVENDPEIKPRAEATVVSFWECGAKVKTAPTIVPAEGGCEDG